LELAPLPESSEVLPGGRIVPIELAVAALFSVVPVVLAEVDEAV